MSSQEVANTLWSLCGLPSSVCLHPATRLAVQQLAHAARQRCLAAAAAAAADAAEAGGDGGGRADAEPRVLAQLSCAAGWAARACAPAGGWEVETSPQGGHSSSSRQQQGGWEGEDWRHDPSSWQHDRALSPTPAPAPPSMTLHPPDSAHHRSAAAWHADGDGGAAPELPTWFAAHWQPLLAAVVHQAMPRLAAFTAHDLVGLAQGLSYAQPFLATGLLDRRPLFARVAEAAAALARAGAMDGAALADLAAACARARAPQRGLALLAARAVAARPAAHPPQVLANVLWALTSARVRDQALLERVSGALLSDAVLLSAASSSASSVSSSASPSGGRQSPDGAAAAAQQRASHSADLREEDGRRQGLPPRHVEQEEEEEVARGAWEADAPLRGDAGSLLGQLGWEADTEEEEDEEQAARRRQRHRGAQRWEQQQQQQQAPPEDVPAAEPADAASGGGGSGVFSSAGAAQAARWASRVLRAPLEAYAEPQRSSAALTWTVLAWAFAKSSYHQHQLFDRLAAAVLGGAAPPSLSPAERQPAARDGEAGGDEGAGGGSPLAPAACTGRHALARLSTSCVVQLLWAFALHGHSHAVLLHEASHVLAARVLRGELRPREVATVGWAYARLQHYEPLLFSAVLHEAQANVHR